MRARALLTDFQFDVIGNTSTGKCMALTLDRILELFPSVTPFAIAFLLIFPINVPIIPQECMGSPVFGDYVRFYR